MFFFDVWWWLYEKVLCWKVIKWWCKKNVSFMEKNFGLSDCNNIGLKGNKNVFLDENGKKVWLEELMYIIWEVKGF